MAEVLLEFTEPVSSPDGRQYVARACGGEDDIGHWQGWIEFVPFDGGEVVRSQRETTQPNRTNTEYWATGLTPVFLEGALRRALNPLTIERPVIAPPASDGPAPNFAVTKPVTTSILNPFSVIRKGEALLRRELSALAAWHLVNIVQAHELSDASAAELAAMRAPDLVDLIVTRVQDRVAAGAR